MDSKDQNILTKMLEEIEFLNNYTRELNFEAFSDSEEKKRTISMTLINIGELVRHFSSAFRKAHKNLPFDDLLGLRNIAAHGYKSLRFDFIWRTVTEEIPKLETQIKSLR